MASSRGPSRPPPLGPPITCDARAALHSANRLVRGLRHPTSSKPLFIKSRQRHSTALREIPLRALGTCRPSQRSYAVEAWVAIRDTPGLHSLVGQDEEVSLRVKVGFGDGQSPVRHSDGYRLAPGFQSHALCLPAPGRLWSMDLISAALAAVDLERTTHPPRDTSLAVGLLGLYHNAWRRPPNARCPRAQIWLVPSSGACWFCPHVSTLDQDSVTRSYVTAFERPPIFGAGAVSIGSARTASNQDAGMESVGRHISILQPISSPSSGHSLPSLVKPSAGNTPDDM